MSNLFDLPPAAEKLWDTFRSSHPNGRIHSEMSIDHRGRRLWIDLWDLDWLGGAGWRAEPAGSWHLHVAHVALADDWRGRAARRVTLKTLTLAIGDADD